MTFRIFTCSDDPAVQTAAAELVRYGKGKLVRTEDANFADIVLHSENSSRFRDSFKLQSMDNKLYITGSNARSVLYGAYKYLKSFGYAFLYPGDEGEIVPEDPQFRINGFHIEETASRTFRGMAFRPFYTVLEEEDKILEEAFKLLNWMAKNQYNLFFMEGYDEARPGDKYSKVNGRCPLQHVEYLLKDKSPEERLRICRKAKRTVEEARKYGFLIERGGHGWNYGVPEHYGVNHHLSLDEAFKALKAKGKINETAEVAVSTWFQICLGSEEVRQIYADHITDFLAEHRGEADIAAVWMGDGYDNKCQCADCIRQPFSDLYLDVFRRVALKCREVLPELTLECLIYFETLEPPTKNWLEGLDNVILNLAVWNQCYFHKLDDPACRLKDWIPDYRNNGTHDTPNGKRIINFDQYLPYQGWRRIVGDEIRCLVFNYITLFPWLDRHFMSYDAALLFENSLCDFDRLNIDGMVDCQCHCSWDKPANLQLYAAGRLLWNKEEADPGAIRRELFHELYGVKAEQVAAYCDKVYALIRSGAPYHLQMSETPDLRKSLDAGLEELGKDLEAISPLPKGREKYFRESLDELRKLVRPEETKPEEQAE